MGAGRACPVRISSRESRSNLRSSQIRQMMENTGTVANFVYMFRRVAE